MIVDWYDCFEPVLITPLLPFTEQTTTRPLTPDLVDWYNCLEHVLITPLSPLADDNAGHAHYHGELINGCSSAVNTGGVSIAAPYAERQDTTEGVRSRGAVVI